MNILLVGGPGSLINNIIIKLNKEGHRIYLLTGSKYKRIPYQKVFERYNFTYDSPCLNEIFESVSPDLTLYLGAYDTNYTWEEEEKDAAVYVNGLTNLLMAYARKQRGKFLYLSSEEVYSGHYPEDIGEQEVLTPEEENHRSMALALGEKLCESYREYRGKDIVTLRLGHLYSIPKKRKECKNICARFCLEALQNKTVTIVEDNHFSMLYETDAVEYIYRLFAVQKHQASVYNLASSAEISEYELAVMVQDAFSENKEEPEIEIISRPVQGERRVLSNRLFDSEYGNPFCCEVKTIVNRTADLMKKKSYEYLRGDKVKLPFWKRVVDKSGWFVKASIPFIENLAGFFLFYFLDSRFGGGSFFSKLDFFLLYVLLFAIYYGQQQATFSTVLAIIGFCAKQVSVRNGFEVILDADTYIWIAELFVLGLVIGYMKDQLSAIKKENEEEKEYLSEQLTDIQDIHTSNVRVKDALETQIVNQSDSVGKIYSITSALDQYSSEEVLFYAAEILGKLMKSKDVAIYTVSNADYARLFSYTSVKAKSLGNSIRYPEMEDLYETLAEGKVFINRKMDERYPLMANAIFENDRMEMLVFVWGLSWEQMTLGQANQLAIISSLIQNAVLRANRYMEALEQQRHVEDSRLLTTDAFTTLVKAHMQASDKGLTECTLLKILTGTGDNIADGKILASKLRLSDYVGTLADDNLYVLLSNTTRDDAGYVIRRFDEAGYATEFVEEKIE